MVALGLGLAGITGCSDSAGPEAGEVTTQDLQELEDELAGIDERVGVLEEGGVTGGDVISDPSAGDDTTAFFGDTESYLGEEVTVSAAVSELTPTADVGASFLIGGDVGDPIPVVWTGEPPTLGVDDVVQVTGTVYQVQQDTFEEDFGIAADDLFEDAAGWFSAEEGDVAISAGEVTVLQAQAD
ncbi:hypothetical protein D0Z06_21565 [Geodermatophilus marinus]|nr:hypothetical protein D0Z06_21565 [Geodermatophilus sp. LHW52908]